MDCKEDSFDFSVLVIVTHSFDLSSFRHEKCNVKVTALKTIKFVLLHILILDTI